MRNNVKRQEKHSIHYCTGNMSVYPPMENELHDKKLDSNIVKSKKNAILYSDKFGMVIIIATGSILMRIANAWQI